MTVEDGKNAGLYDVELVKDTDQIKKVIKYSDYVDTFLKEIPRELPSAEEKRLVFFILWRTILDFKLNKQEDLKQFSVLDIRSKDGQFIEYLTSRDLVLHAEGVEMVEDWVNYAFDKGRNIYHTPDLTQLPYEDESFDIVYSYRTFGRVRDNYLFLKELVRVTKRYIFLLVDDVTRNPKTLYATSMDIRSYKKWIKDLNMHELVMSNNLVNGNPNEKVVLLYKKPCVACGPT